MGLLVGKVVAERKGAVTLSTTALAVITTAMAAAGCFYMEPINGRPVAKLEKTLPGPHYKGDPVTFTATKSDDPDGDTDSLKADWRAVECLDDEGIECPPIDGMTADGGIFQSFTFDIPGKKPVRVFLTVTDRSGASDIVSTLVNVTNRDPTIELNPEGYKYDGAYPMGTWVDIYAMVGDPDDDETQVAWEVFEPGGSIEADLGWEPITGEEARRLTPDVDGVWQVRGTITDGEGGEAFHMIPIHFEDDVPPCIAATSPDATVDGTYIVDSDEGPRRLALLAVSDDLDFYPPPANPGDFLGTAELSWKISTPDTSGVFVTVPGHEVSDYFVDPEAFAPGDEIQVRVEIADRISRTIPCADDQSSCSINGDTCLQRVTWKVEIR